MSGFDAAWLDLREPADRAARDAGLVAALGDWARARGPIAVVDLGAGTGASLRALAPTLPRASWTMADADPALLALALDSAEALGVLARCLRIDLARDLAAAFDPAPALVTASAFFDLASAAWIDRFALTARSAGAAVYAALSYDGAETWRPPHPLDDPVHAAFLADMRRDKGLGPALGAEAGAYLAARLGALGYVVRTAQSPWRLSAPRDADLIAALADGVADAAHAPDDWRAARRAALGARIGHLDLFATLSGA